MSEAEATPAEERLPWLGEDAEQPRDHRTRDAIGLAIVAALLIFGVSYWLASQSWQRARDLADNGAGSPPAAAPLPKTPQTAQAQKGQKVAAKPRDLPRAAAEPKNAPRVAARRQTPTVSAPARAPQVAQRTTAPATERTAAKAEAPARQRVAAKAPAAAKQRVAAKAPTTSEVVKAVAENNASKPKIAAVVPQKKVAVAAVPQPRSARLVRVGAFASPIEARLGWRSMVRAYPVLAHMPATVVDASSSRSKPAYRFEIATNPQVSSDVLCQRMARINFSCAVATR